jgi:hypothetical protein
VIDRGNNGEGTMGEKRWSRGEKKNWGKKLIFPNFGLKFFHIKDMESTPIYKG